MLASHILFPLNHHENQLDVTTYAICRTWILWTRGFVGIQAGGCIYRIERVIALVGDTPWQINMIWKMIFHFNWEDLTFHVNFQGCEYKYLASKLSGTYSKPGPL